MFVLFRQKSGRNMQVSYSINCSSCPFIICMCLPIQSWGVNSEGDHPRSLQEQNSHTWFKQKKFQSCSLSLAKGKLTWAKYKRQWILLIRLVRLTLHLSNHHFNTARNIKYDRSISFLECGKLNFDQYAQVCTKLVKDPTHNSFAMKFKTFSDFETP